RRNGYNGRYGIWYHGNSGGNKQKFYYTIRGPGETAKNSKLFEKHGAEFSWRFLALDEWQYRSCCAFCRKRRWSGSCRDLLPRDGFINGASILQWSRCIRNYFAKRHK